MYATLVFYVYYMALLILPRAYITSSNLSLVLGTLVLMLACGTLTANTH